MTVHGLRMQVAGGRGLVVAGPVAALFVDDDGSDVGAHEFVGALVEAITTAPDPGGDPGTALVRRVGGLVAGGMSRGAPVTPFALVAETAAGVAVMIVGPVTVRYTGAEGASEQLSGRNAATWVDRIFHGTPASVIVSTDSGDAPPPHPLGDLGHGAVGGSGFELVPREDAATGAPPGGAHAVREPEPGPELQPEPQPEPQYQWEPVVGGPVDAAPDGAAPDGAAQDGAAQDGAAQDGAAQDGAAPDGAAPDGAGAAEPPAWTPAWTPVPEPEPVPGPQADPASPWSQPIPAAAAPEPGPEPGPEPQPEPEPEPEPQAGPPVLHRPDGSTLDVGRLLVLGREPQISPLVVSGAAEAVTLDDEARVTSRVHASVVAEGDSLTVTDLGSANGTWVLHAGDSDWTELTANEPTALRAGGRIRIGSEEFVVGAPPA